MIGKVALVVLLGLLFPISGQNPLQLNLTWDIQDYIYRCSASFGSNFGPFSLILDTDLPVIPHLVPHHDVH